MIIAIPLDPQPVLHTNREGDTPSWRWAYKNQWIGQNNGSSTNPSQYKLPMVGACWLEGIDPLNSGASDIMKWVPYRVGWVVNVNGRDHIVSRVELTQLNLDDHEVEIFDEQHGTTSAKANEWNKNWVWMLYLR